jgi:chromodomain-helicase-DNA-binding protein 4
MHNIYLQDGNTKGSVRQKAMDDFNKAGSDHFIFLLTTRAGVSFSSS